MGCSKTAEVKTVAKILLPPVELAVADEISDSYDARCLACAGGDPRRWRVTAGGVRV